MAAETEFEIEGLWDKYLRRRRRTPRTKSSPITVLVGIIVKSLMLQYRDYNEKDELMSCGVLGLIDAVNKFDRLSVVKFQTYATLRIRGEINRLYAQTGLGPPQASEKKSTASRVPMRHWRHA
jgi:RNA polymerase sigma factor for flagellar operon FliA